jgi:hypothetical protein
MPRAPLSGYDPRGHGRVRPIKDGPSYDAHAWMKHPMVQRSVSAA